MDREERMRRKEKQKQGGRRDERKHAEARGSARKLRMRESKDIKNTRGSYPCAKQVSAADRRCLRGTLGDLSEEECLAGARWPTPGLHHIYDTIGFSTSQALGGTDRNNRKKAQRNRKELLCRQTDGRGCDDAFKYYARYTQKDATARHGRAY